MAGEMLRNPIGVDMPFSERLRLPIGGQVCLVDNRVVVAAGRPRQALEEAHEMFITMARSATMLGYSALSGDRWKENVRNAQIQARLDRYSLGTVSRRIEQGVTFYIVDGEYTYRLTHLQQQSRMEIFKIESPYPLVVAVKERGDDPKLILDEVRAYR